MFAPCTEWNLSRFRRAWLLLLRDDSRPPLPPPGLEEDEDKEEETRNMDRINPAEISQPERNRYLIMGVVPCGLVASLKTFYL